MPVNQAKKVSESFSYTKSLPDEELSENYDEDPFYQDVPDVNGILTDLEEEEEEKGTPDEAAEEARQQRAASRQEFLKLREQGLQNSVTFDFNMSDVSFS